MFAREQTEQLVAAVKELAQAAAELYDRMVQGWVRVMRTVERAVIHSLRVMRRMFLVATRTPAFRPVVFTLRREVIRRKLRHLR